jgi:hypothetical protein
MFDKHKIQKHGEQAEEVVLDSTMSGYSNSHGINKWHLRLRVQFEDGSTDEAACSAYPTGPVGAFNAGDIVPVRYLPDNRTKVEVDRDALVSASLTRRAEGREKLIRLGEENSRGAAPERPPRTRLNRPVAGAYSTLAIAFSISAREAFSCSVSLPCGPSITIA